jgi:hypothetical protein
MMLLRISRIFPLAVTIAWLLTSGVALGGQLPYASSSAPTLEEFCEELLSTGHPTGQFLRCRVIDKGDDFITVKIYYRPNGLARLLEGNMNWSVVKVKDNRDGTYKVSVIKEDPDTNVPWGIYTALKNQVVAEFMKEFLVNIR